MNVSSNFNIKRVFILVFIISMPLVASAQEPVPKKRLSISINRSNSNHYYPRLTGDGQLMFYVSDLAQREGLKVWYTERLSNGQWGLQEVYDEKLFNMDLNTEGGYFISYDGKTIVFTSRRFGGIGGWDIWITEREGGKWTTPQNAGKPVNTLGHEGDPSLSPDGKYLYFMRCAGISEDDARDCKIYKAERKENGYFNDPVELPPEINQEHETSPLILADNKSLIFSSSRPGGAGGMDLYLTRYEDGSWSDPENMDFINTEDDDKYISIPVRGDLAYYTDEVKNKKNIFMAKIPESFQPYKVLWVEGKVVDSNENPLDAAVQIKESGKNTYETINTDNEGFFSVFLTEGAQYDLSVLEKTGAYFFQSNYFDLDSLSSSERSRVKFDLEKINTEDSYLLNNLFFEPYSSDISPISEMELQRLIFIMQKNPELNLNVEVYLHEFKSDTVQNDPDLTEVKIDTIITTKVIERIDSVMTYKEKEKLDSAMAKVNTIPMDSLENDTLLTDSLHQELISYTEKIVYDTIEVEKLKYTYHNDRTKDQGEAIVDYLIDKGAPKHRLSSQGFRGRPPFEMKIGEEYSVDKNYSVWIRIR